MTADIDHNKLLTTTAKTKFKPHGIVQKGQSRIFLCDNFWYTIVIEFQPSSWDKGTYLNVSVDFNFYPRDYFAFGYGGRLKEFVTFNNENQFQKDVSDLCDIAIKKIAILKTQFADLSTAKDILSKELNPADSWNNLDLSILCMLTSDKATAKAILNKVLSDQCDHDWEIQRRKFAVTLMDWFDKPNFDIKIDEQIKATRKLKKLDK